MNLPHSHDAQRCITFTCMAVSRMFTMRMPTPIRTALERAARDDMRSASQLVTKIVAEYLVRTKHLDPAQLHVAGPVRRKKKGT